VREFFRIVASRYLSSRFAVFALELYRTLSGCRLNGFALTCLNDGEDGGRVAGAEAATIVAVAQVEPSPEAIFGIL
jgi:hypothetical protein